VGRAGACNTILVPFEINQIPQILSSKQANSTPKALPNQANKLERCKNVKQASLIPHIWICLIVDISGHRRLVHGGARAWDKRRV
jgi:hypothetical protein